MSKRKQTTVLGTEYKFFDVSLSQSSIGTAGTIASESVLLIQPGDGESERIGRKLILKHIEIHYFVELPAATLQSPHPSSDLLRIIVYIDKQCNGAAAEVFDIMEPSLELLTFYNLTNQGRFEILMDRIHQLGYQTVAGTANATFFSFGRNYAQANFSAHLDLKINYKDDLSGTTVLADVASNNIGILLFTQQNKLMWTGKVRVRYLDN